MIARQSTHDDTVRMPALRLLPPATPDRQDRIRLNRRGRIIRDLLTGGTVLGLAIAAQPISDAYWSLVAALGGVL